MRFWRPPLETRAPAPVCRQAQRRDPSFTLLEKIGGLGVLVKVAGLALLNPDPDQVPADIVPLGEPVEGLAGQELLSDLAFKLNAVRAVPSHGLPSSKARPHGPECPPQGATPIGGQSSRGVA